MGHVVKRKVMTHEERLRLINAPLPTFNVVIATHGASRGPKMNAFGSILEETPRRDEYFGQRDKRGPEL